MNVKETHLYKVLAPRIRKHDRKFFGEALQQAADAPDSAFWGEGHNLMSAFVWASTPQGCDFWLELHLRLRAAGHYAELADKA